MRFDRQKGNTAPLGTLQCPLSLRGAVPGGGFPAASRPDAGDQQTPARAPVVTEALFAKMGRRLTGSFETCSECGCRFEKSRVNQKACSPVCREIRRRRLQGTEGILLRKARARDRDQLRGVTAPDLKVACEQLEALCTPANRPEWPQIIATWKTAPVPGYPNLTRLARSCVQAKLRLLR